jgi:Chalcone isomerase-like
MNDVAEGDEMVLTEIPGKGVTFALKGKDLVTIPGEDFAKVLWSIWLGSEPPNPDLKEGLLGKLD